MVRGVDIDAAGDVAVTVALTVAGCPMRNTLTADVTKAVSAVDGVRSVSVAFDVMTDDERRELQQELRGGQPTKEIPFARPNSLTKVIAVASGKGGVG
jgi:ATP-binding protein involved in chromosome partitioning